MTVSWLMAGAILAGACAVRLGSAGPADCEWSRIQVLTDIRRRRSERNIATGLPQLCEDIARSLRAGLSLQSALGEAATSDLPRDLRSDVALVVERCGNGVTTSDSLRTWRDDRVEVAGVALTVTALDLAASAGGRVAQAVDGVADTLRSEVALAAEIRSLAAQAEASAALIAVLPLVFGFVAGGTDPETVRFLFATQLGRLCLAGGLALDIVAFAWMRRIVRSVA